MRYWIFFAGIFLLAFNLSASDLRAKSYNKGLTVVPKPLSVIFKDGNFVLNPQTRVYYSSPELKQDAEYLVEKLSASTGYSIGLTTILPENNVITLSLDCLRSPNEEAYFLDSSEKAIVIKANTSKGIFYGLQTLLQLLPAEIESKSSIIADSWEITNLVIEDEPRYKWRGMMLDICRHFFSADFIKKQIDILAMYKINSLHLHLTDDQAWRIKVEQYPKLTEIGAYRTEFDGSVYGGFLTQEEIKDIIDYARIRYINIVPEIELPGHAMAALASYPDLSCTGGPFKVRTHWGVEKNVFCAGKETVFEFLENVLNEIIPLFPGEYIHIGGDECPKDKWSVCLTCKKRMEEEGIKDVNELQSYFVRRIEKIVNQHGKKMIGFDEILDGGLAPNATVMSWRGEKGGIAAAEMNHDVVMVPGNWLYIDYYQGDKKIEPVAIGGYTPLKKIYDYDPLPLILPIDKQKHILGAQANMWTEYVLSEELVEYRIYPRILALAELTWTPKDLKNYVDFENRIHNQMVRLDKHNVNYHIPQPEQPYGSCNKLVFTDSIEVAFKISRPLPMIYTLDGSEPRKASSVYKDPLKFKESSTLKIRTLLPSGVMSKTRIITIEKQDYAPSVAVKNIRSGLQGRQVQGKYSSSKDISKKAKWTKKNIKSFKDIEVISSTSDLSDDVFYALELEGYIDIPEDNVYYFSTDIDQFWLGGQLLISNENELKRFSRHDTSIALKKGLHPIKIVYLSNIYKGWLNARRELSIQFRTKDQTEFKPISADMLFY